MHTPTILMPLFALAAWTSVVLLLIPIVRIKAAKSGAVTPADFKLGESANVPPGVSIPNRNYMNLLELPMLFYVVCLLFYITEGGSAVVLVLAWTYFALRVVHSLIHLTYNHVIHRLIAFAASNWVLTALWVMAAVHIFA